MPTAAGNTIVCSSCEKKYVWKPQLAGKNVRCKCGQLIPVPAVESRPAVKPADEVADLYDLADAALAAPKADESEAIAPPVSMPGVEDDMYRCPSCGQGMVPGAIICSECGFNLKTGEKVNLKRPGGVQAGVSKAASSPNSAFNIPRRTKPQVQDDHSGQMMKLIIPLALVVLIAAGIVGFKMFGGGTSAKPASTNKDDVSVASLSDEYGAYEIHDWFKQNPSRLAGEWSAKQAIYHADEFQQMGAKKVLVFGATMTRAVAIELPDDKDLRGKLFEYENKFAKEHFYKPAKDEGQKYIVLNLGL